MHRSVKKGRGVKVLGEKPPVEASGEIHLYNCRGRFCGDRNRRSQSAVPGVLCFCTWAASQSVVLASRAGLA